MPTRLITTTDGRQIPDPRSTATWRKLAKQVAHEEPHCWLRFDGCTGTSTTGDHIIPVTVRPDLALVRSNVRGACAPCNYARRNLPVTALRLGRSDDTTRPGLGVFDP